MMSEIDMIDVGNMVDRLRRQTAIPNRNEVADMVEAILARAEAIEKGADE